MQQLENSMDTCLTKAGATKEELEKFIAGEDIPKLKCFWECVMMADGTVIPHISLFKSYKNRRLY